MATRRLPTLVRALASACALLPGCAHVPPAPLAPEASASAIEARSLDDPGLRAFLEANLAGAPGSWPRQHWDLPSLTLAALYYQPRLDVARARWAAAGASIETAGARPNPTLSVAPELSTNPDPGVSPWVAAVHLDWTLETAGKRGHRIHRAEALAEAERHALAANAWQVRRDLRQALLDLAAGRERIAGLERQLASYQEAVALLEQRVRSGAASQAELVPARLALIQAGADRAAAEQQRLAARARVAAAVGVPLRALVDVSLEFSLADEGAALLGLDEVEAKRAALHDRADVRAGLAEYAASEHALRLELAKQYPDLHVGNGYQFDQGQNKWMLGIGLELPLLNRNQGPIAEAVAARAEVAARFVALQASVLGEIERALASQRGARQQVESFESLVAEREAELKRVESGLALGAFDHLTLVGARIEWLRSQLALVDARVELQRTLGDLEAAVQGPLAPPEALERSDRALPGSNPS